MEAPHRLPGVSMLGIVVLTLIGAHTHARNFTSCVNNRFCLFQPTCVFHYTSHILIIRAQHTIRFCFYASCSVPRLPMEGRCAVETWAQFRRVPCGAKLTAGTLVLICDGSEEITVFHSDEKRIMASEFDIVTLT